MQTINARQLKSNPSTALRNARTHRVVVMNRDNADAVLIGFEHPDGLAHVHQAAAVSLFRDHLISMAAAAKLASNSTAAMLTRLISRRYEYGTT